MNYQEKYLKYKKKYLSLKNNMIGGGEELEEIQKCVESKKMLPDVKGEVSRRVRCGVELKGRTVDQYLAEEQAAKEKEEAKRKAAEEKRNKIFAEMQSTESKIGELRNQIKQLEQKNQELREQMASI